MANPFYEPGRYWGKVTGQAMGVTKKSNAQFVLSFLVMGKVDPTKPDGDLLSCAQYERSIFKVINENTVDYVVEDLQAIGFDRDGFKYLDPRTPDFFDFKDKEFEFYCTHETYEGKQREKWGIARSGGGVKVDPLEDKELRKLDSMFGKKLKAMAKKTLSPTNIVGTPATVPCGDDGTVPVDDIPF